MHSSHVLVGLAAWISTSVAHSVLPRVAASPPVSPIEGLTQAGYKTAYLIDTKNYAALGEVMTPDIKYDSSSLGRYGGKSNNLAEVQAALAGAIGETKVEHLVTNLYVREFITPNKARVDT